MPATITSRSRPRLPETIPADVRAILTPAMCKPRGLPPQTYRVVEITNSCEEIERLFTKQQLANTVCWRDTHDGVWITGNIIHLDNNRWRPTTLALAGMQLCRSCNNVFEQITMRDGQCRSCRGDIIPWMQPKASPEGGWVRHGEGDIFFGLELEVELPVGMHRRSFIDKLHYDKHVPLVWTKDGSLRNGCEFNSHPMSMQYIVDNNQHITSFIQQIVANGATHKAYDGADTAAIHIHVSNPAFADNLKDNAALNVWLRAHRDDLLVIGKRASDRFNHWCEVNEPWRDRRMYLNNREHTMEARGFSSRVLLEEPDSLPRICAWLMALAKASRTDPDEWIRLSPQSLVRWAGYPYGGFPDTARISLSQWAAARARIMWQKAKAEYIQAIQCSAVGIRADVSECDASCCGLTMNDLRDIVAGRSVCTTVYNGEHMRTISRTPSGRMHTLNIPWHWIIHPTLPMPVAQFPESEE